MDNKLISKRNLYLLFLVLLGFVLLTRIPFKSFFRNFVIESFVESLNYAVISVIIILSVWFIVRRAGYLSEGGFRDYNRKNYWMLLIPIIFPGILFSSNISSCEVFNLHWVFITAVSLIRGVMEEVLCRGLIQGYMMKKHPGSSMFRITLASAIIFALLHFIALFRMDFFNVFNQVIYAFFVGLLFSAIFLRVKNVWLLGISHGILNVMANRCETIDSGTEISSWGEYFAGLGGFILILSPCVLMYWLLVRTAKKAGPANDECKGINFLNGS